MSQPVRESPCAACGPSTGRREFLREAAGIATGILLSLGLSPGQAAASMLSLGAGRRVPGSFEISYPFPLHDGVMIDKEQQLILARARGMVYAFALSCPHQNTALRWLEEDTAFQCPKHKSRYRPDGTFISGRATRNMDRLPIRSDGKLLFVDAERVYESDKDPSGWAGAAVKV